MDIEAIYSRWCKDVKEPALLQALEALSHNQEEKNDCFWRELAFGTGGLRGKIGVGSNRMNVYTVAKATLGLARYLLGSGKNPSVAIAYDTRNFSREFAATAAGVLAGAGVAVYLYEDVRPTPMLSFAVRHLSATAGIVITASHNPKEYNGYKVYGFDGGQITDQAAAAILQEISGVDPFSDCTLPDIGDVFSLPGVTKIGEAVDAAYFFKLSGLVCDRTLVKDHAKELSILYSPLHGAGNMPVRRILRELGFTNVSVVPQQEHPDGNFPTCPYPNPEEPGVFALAKAMAQNTSPDLIFATDPDCDRIGALVQDQSGAFTVLSGNQMGVLLCDYLIGSRLRTGEMPKNPAVIKTIVTSDMVRNICLQNGVTLFEVLTGFKYIGELVGQWEQSGDYSFLLGFEESYGYLAGDFVRDKDAVIAAALIAEMALYHKRQGRTLFEALQALYRQYGYFYEELVSVTLPGQEGQQRIEKIMKDLRENYPVLLAPLGALTLEDYKRSVRILSTGETEALTLPASNVLKFILPDGTWLVVRPSGTEPKIKLYLCARGSTMEAAKARARQLLGAIEGLLH